jgi:Protein of unknown function (DUF2934)
MAPRKNTTTTRTPSKRKDRSKSEIGNGAPADAVGFGSNGHPTMAPASEASIRAQIEFRAYEGFLARGGAHGDDLADWFKAERELNVRAVTASRPHHAD